MQKKMNREEYQRTVSVVLEEIAKQKDIDNAIIELEPKTYEDGRHYTLEDVTSAISQVSPEDSQLANRIVQEIEYRKKPKELLTSLEEKVQLYENIKKAKSQLATNYGIIYSRKEYDLFVLARQGIFKQKDVNQYLQEVGILGIVMTDMIPEPMREKDSENIGLRNGFVIGSICELISVSSGWLFDDRWSYNWPMYVILGFAGSVLVGFFSGAYSAYKKEKKNIGEINEKKNNFESEFAYRLMNIGELAQKFYAQISQGDIPIYNVKEEDKVIKAVSNLRTYFSDILKVLPEISKSYLAVKEAESGLPVARLTLPAAK